MQAALALRRRLFRIDHKQVDYDRRRFAPCSARIKARIKEYFGRFIDGYHFALETPDIDRLGRRLDNEIASEFIGFAYEGAGLSLAMMDELTPWRRDRVAQFVRGPAAKHDIITMVGTGFVLARLPWLRLNIDKYLARLDPRVCWVAVDGFGFHQGLFHHQALFNGRLSSRPLTGTGEECFFQGVGRSLWFSTGASPSTIETVISRYPVPRQHDLWAGVGLAAAFAGGVYEELDAYDAILDELKQRSASCLRDFELGVVFAAFTRCRAANRSPWTARACGVILEMTLEDAGGIAMRAFDELDAEFKLSSTDELRRIGYSTARRRIREALSVKLAAAS